MTRTRAVTVRATGPRALIQDLGRPGYAALGVPPSGALDQGALRLANRLVGNPEDAAGVEVLLGGLTVRAENPCTVAITGAPVTVHTGRHDREFATPLYLKAGQELTLGTAAVGMRCYLAVSGGIAVPPELGSAATDTLSGLGPKPLQDNDILELGPPHGAPSGADTAAARHWPDTLTVPVLLGPRADWFTDAAAQLRAGAWQVSADSDRVGLRLDGTTLDRAPGHDGELPSEPIRTGAIQVPSSGLPLVFLADHPTTGGYPVVGVVDTASLADLAQARPGTRVRFRPRA